MRLVLWPCEMRILTSVALLAFMLAGTAPLYGQTQPVPDNSSTPIVTDRPTVTFRGDSTHKEKLESIL